MKTNSFKILMMLFAALMLWSCARDIEPFTGNILGKITDAKSGEVLQGVNVTIVPSGTSRTTGGDGYFEFRDLEPKQYEIQAQKSGYITNSKIVNVVAGRDVSGDIQLTPITQDGILALSVSSLNFGSQNSSLSFNIQNNGNKSFNWNISGLDNADWLSVNPSTGTLAAGKSNAVAVTLNRDRITEYKEVTIIVNADNESMPLKIIAEVENKTSKISLSSSTLNFGTEYSSLTFDVKNIGNAGDVDWNVSAVDVDWITVSPVEGTTAMTKSSVVKVDVDRNKLEVGKHSTTIIVNADGESLRVTINVEKSSGRYLDVFPTELVLGTNDEESMIVRSYGGATAYELYGRGDFSWATFNKVQGVIPEYDPDNYETVELLTVYADRTGLAPGEYTFTLIIRSDLGDYEIPVRMTVEEGEGSSLGSAEVVTCNDDLEFVVTGCKMSGTTATIDYTVENIGNSSVKFNLWGDTGGRSYIYDNAGNQYDFGYNKATLTLGTNSSYSGVEATIPAGVKIKGSIKIYNVSDAASAFSNISIYSGTFQTYLILKNVPIEGRYSASTGTTQTTGSIISCSDDLEFTLIDCKRNASNNVTISYKVQNVGSTPHNLILWGSTGGYSYIYDNAGNQYNFGHNKATLTLGTSASYSGVEATVPSNVFLKGTIVIYNVDTSADEISNVTLRAGTTHSDLVFKNIKIRK